MFKFALNKLVRDKLIENLDPNTKCVFHYLTQEECMKALKVKLYEEIEELEGAESAETQAIEAADILEVMLNLTEYPFPRPGPSEELQSCAHNFIYSDCSPTCGDHLLYAILKFIHPVSIKEIEDARITKYKKSGGFANGLFVSYIIKYSFQRF